MDIDDVYHMLWPLESPAQPNEMPVPVRDFGDILVFTIIIIKTPI